MEVFFVIIMNIISIKNKKFNNMDKIHKDYLVLPMHTKMTIKDAETISKEINIIIKNIN